MAAVTGVETAVNAPQPAMNDRKLSTMGVKRTHYYTGDSVPSIAGASGAVPWTRPQPETPICPVCPISSSILHLSLDPKYTELLGGADDSLKLTNPWLEFRFGVDSKSQDIGFIAVSLGEIQVPPNGLWVKLDDFEILIDELEVPLGVALAEHNITSGTLTVLVPGRDGLVQPLVSVVQVLDEKPTK